MHLNFFEASEMRATCALCHMVDFGVLFLRSNLLCTHQNSTSASFFVPAQTFIILTARGLDALFSSCAVVSVFWFWREIVFGVTYLLTVQYSCGVVAVFWFWREIVNILLLFIPLLALTDGHF